MNFADGGDFLKKENLLDKFLHKLVDEYLDKIAFALLVIIAIIIRLVLMKETDLSPDYNTYYLEWVKRYKGYGIIKGLGAKIGDYYVPYNVMYAIASLFPTEPYVPLTLFSTIAELVSAFFIGKIVFILLEERGIEIENTKRIAGYTSVATLYLPYVVFNGALWKQCDAIYAVFLVISFYYLLKDKMTLTFVFFAISFGFKLQAVFFVPMFLVVYMIKKNFSILQFVWIPVMYMALGLPSVLCKKGLKATYLAYFKQTQETSTEGYGMVSFYPNFYNFGLDNFDEILKLPGILLTVAALVMMAAFAYHNRPYFEAKGNMLFLGLYMAWTCCMLLPGMHERYDYVIVLMMTVYAAAVCRKFLPEVIVMNICSFLVYVIVLFKPEELSIVWVSVLEVSAYIVLTYRFIKNVLTEEKKTV